MTLKVNMANGSFTGVDFLNDAGTVLAQIRGYDDGSSNGHLSLYTTLAGVASEKIRIDSAGNVGIGTSSPSYKFDVSTTGSSVPAAFRSDQTESWVMLKDSGTTLGHVRLGSSAGAMLFYAGNAERARIDSSGNLLVGTAALNGSWGTRLTLSSNNGTTTWAVGPYSTATNFVISAGSGVGVYLGGTSATSWSSASDERVKTDLQPIENAAQKVSTLRAVTGRYIADETQTRKSFLIAQDVQAVLPEAVNVQDDEQGTLGLAYTDVIPLLVAAIKEQQALITQLQADVSTLKGAK